VRGNKEPEVQKQGSCPLYPGIEATVQAKKKQSNRRTTNQFIGTRNQIIGDIPCSRSVKRKDGVIKKAFFKEIQIVLAR
jgi:hypothetical protein